MSDQKECAAELADRLASMPAAEAIRGPKDWATIMAALRGVAQAAVTPSREHIARVIAGKIACEQDCMDCPGGCGCSDDAADAVMALYSPAFPSTDRAAPPSVALEADRMAKAKDALFNIARIHGYRLNDVELSEAVRAVTRAPPKSNL